jgi:hypothetical protein
MTQYALMTMSLICLALISCAQVKMCDSIVRQADWIIQARDTKAYSLSEIQSIYGSRVEDLSALFLLHSMAREIYDNPSWDAVKAQQYAKRECFIRNIP